MKLGGDFAVGIPCKLGKYIPLYNTLAKYCDKSHCTHDSYSPTITYVMHESSSSFLTGQEHMCARHITEWDVRWNSGVIK